MSYPTSFYRKWTTGRAGFACCVLILLCCACQPKKPPLRGVSTQSDGPGVRRALARALLAQEEYGEALKILRQALQEEGGEGDPRTHTLIGVALRELGFYPEARASLTKAISLDAKQGEAWNALGLLEQVSQKPEAAILAFREACRLSPDSAEYHNNLGFSLYIAGRFEEAVKELRTAVVLAPKVPRYRNNLGFALGGLGEVEAAKEAFLAAGSEAMAQNNLGVIYEQRGQKALAREAYAAALALDPKLTEAQKNLKRLEASLSTSTPETPEALP